MMSIKRFFKMFTIESFSLFFKKNLYIVIGIFLISAYFMQCGIIDVKQQKKAFSKFQEFEKKRASSFQYWPQYGTYGFRIMYQHDSLSALTSRGIPFDLVAFIDSGERLQLNVNFKGKNAINGITDKVFGLSEFLLIFVGLICIFYGYRSFKNKEYLDFLLSFFPDKKSMFSCIFFVKLFILFVFSAALYILASLLFLINGLSFHPGFLFLYFFETFLMLAFLFSIGFLISVKNYSITTLFLAWFLFVFVFPMAFMEIIEKRSEKITNSYEIELKKFLILMDVEKDAKLKSGSLNLNGGNATKIRQELADKYLYRDYKAIESHENRIMGDIKEVGNLYESLSLIFPTNIFQKNTLDISRKGFPDFISFYEAMSKLKEKFIFYYAKNTFFQNQNKVIPFESHILQKNNTYPTNYPFSVLINLIWLVLLYKLSWFFYSRLGTAECLKLSQEEKASLNPELLEGEQSVLIYGVNKENYKFANEKSLFIYILSELRRMKKGYLFLPASEFVPGDIRIRDIYSLAGIKPLDDLRQRFSELSKDKKSEALLTLAKKVESKFLVFNEFHLGCSFQFLKNNVFNFVKEMDPKRTIINFTSDPLIYDSFKTSMIHRKQNT